MDRNFSAFPLIRYGTQKGIYTSRVYLNYVDKKNSVFGKLLRNIHGVSDTNIFVTNFVILSLIESMELGIIKYDK